MENGLMKVQFSADQVALIKSQIAPKATNDELKLFIYQAQRTGLDPLARQIYAIHRWNSQQGKDTMTIQTSIDGFRVVAERSGDYGGQDEPEFIEQDGKLIACKVSVYRFRGEQRYKVAVGIAYWEEYKQADKNGNVSGLWKKMPHVMLSKVAEAVALRKAYPHDLSGLYTGDEMNQADESQEQSKPKPAQQEMPLPEEPAPHKQTLSPKGFEKGKERISSGEIDVYFKIKNEFHLSEKELKELTETYEGAKAKIKEGTIEQVF